VKALRLLTQVLAVTAEGGTAQPAATPLLKCFIVMPFGIEDLEDLYREFILPVLDECKLECKRGDDIFGSNVIMDDVRAGIAAADLVIAA
jgi:hypothetical protein